MTADLNDHSVIGADHQLSSYDPAHPRRTGLHVVMWILLLLIVAVPLLLFLHHREEAKKAAAAAAKRVTPGITITSATAQKGTSGSTLTPSARSRLFIQI